MKNAQFRLQGTMTTDAASKGVLVVSTLFHSEESSKKFGWSCAVNNVKKIRNAVSRGLELWDTRQMRGMVKKAH